MRVVRRGSGRWPEFRSYHPYLVRLRIEGHSASALLGWHILGYTELTRRFLAHHGQHAFAARCKSQAVFIVEPSRIHAFTDRQRGDDFAVIGVHHRHHFVITANEQASILERAYAASGFEAAVRALGKQQLEKLNERMKRGEYVPHS